MTDANPALVQFTPQTVKQLQGHFVQVFFNPELKLSPLTARLYNLDPDTGTVFLFDVLEHEQQQSADDGISFRVVMQHAIEYMESKCGPTMSGDSWTNIFD